MPQPFPLESPLPMAAVAGAFGMEPPTLADAHLVMNSFNQLAAHFHASTQEEDPRLFAMADYLRLVLRDGLEPFVRVEDERELLQSYVRLLEASRAQAIPLALDTGSPADRTVQVQRHLSCDLVAALVRVLPGDSLPGDSLHGAQLRLSFEGTAGRWACSLHASLRHAAAASVAHRLRTEIERLVQRFGVGADAAFEQEIMVEGDALRWVLRLPRAMHTGHAMGRP